MWTRSHSKIIKNASAKEIWNRWADVNSWHEWVPNIEYCRLEQPFQTGSQFTLKPKGKSAVTVELTSVEKEQRFTRCTRFFGAVMYNTYEMEKAPEGTRFTVTVKVTGPLGLLWRMVVAKKIAHNLPALMRNLAVAVSAPTLKKGPLELNPPVEIGLASQTSKLEAILPKPKKKTQAGLTTLTPKKAHSKASASALKEGKPIKKGKPKSKNEAAGRAKKSPVRKKTEL